MKHNVIVHMGAADWSARVRRPDNSWVRFDFRRMDRKERGTFHRELMNAFRAQRAGAL